MVRESARQRARREQAAASSSTPAIPSEEDSVEVVSSSEEDSSESDTDADEITYNGFPAGGARPRNELTTGVGEYVPIYDQTGRTGWNGFQITDDANQLRIDTWTLSGAHMAQVRLIAGEAIGMYEYLEEGTDRTQAARYNLREVKVPSSVGVVPRTMPPPPSTRSDTSKYAFFRTLSPEGLVALRELLAAGTTTAPDVSRRDLEHLYTFSFVTYDFAIKALGDDRKQPLLNDAIAWLQQRAGELLLTYQSSAWRNITWKTLLRLVTWDEKHLAWWATHVADEDPKEHPLTLRIEGADVKADLWRKLVGDNFFSSTYDHLAKRVRTMKRYVRSKHAEKTQDFIDDVHSADMRDIKLAMGRSLREDHEAALMDLLIVNESTRSVAWEKHRSNREQAHQLRVEAQAEARAETQALERRIQILENQRGNPRGNPSPSPNPAPPKKGRFDHEGQRDRLLQMVEVPKTLPTGLKVEGEWIIKDTWSASKGMEIDLDFLLTGIAKKGSKKAKVFLNRQGAKKVFPIAADGNKYARIRAYLLTKYPDLYKYGAGWVVKKQ